MCKEGSQLLQEEISIRLFGAAKILHSHELLGQIRRIERPSDEDAVRTPRKQEIEGAVRCEGMGCIGLADAGAEGCALCGVVWIRPGRGLRVAGADVGEHASATWEWIALRVDAAGQDVARFRSLGLDHGAHLRRGKNCSGLQGCGRHWVY